ncbi:MAG: response regulator transcription factor [Candidatus Acidiferrales bacterium]
MPIQVLLADDHQIVRQSLRLLLEREGLKVVGEASNGRDAIRMAELTHPDVAVLDVSMPILNGLDAAKEIQKVSPRTKTIFLTVHDEDPYLLDALRSGAKGYVVKTHAAENLIQAGISRRFRPSAIRSWKRRGNSERIAASGPRDG